MEVEEAEARTRALFIRHQAEKKTRRQPATSNNQLIKATPEQIYVALTNPDMLVRWQVPGEMTGQIHAFDLREGGGYTMSLRYPESEKVMKGKSSEREDRFIARFLILEPPHRLMEAVQFDTADPAFGGEMIMDIQLKAQPGGTKVTFAFYDLPSGIKPEDNEAGTRSSLSKLAALLERQPR
ncbi:SRPBCC domain-containing protein [Mucilaginibacter gossypiicola]|nr:SRPBCC domain-containing protein [Mucilaginibacter gossypiicola]